MQTSFSVKGNLVDVFNKNIYPAEIKVEDGKIKVITPLNVQDSSLMNYILPGFIDAHVHIESSMLVPSEFARIAVTHGTVATVSDPHEIANVCGLEGVDFMIANGNKVPFKFYFGAPSCVPATIFETAGASLDSDAVKILLEKEEIKYLSEMMNFPGVLNKDDEVMKKIAAAHQLNKPVDGHAPGLRGEQAKRYIDAGISTDHECFTKEEAEDKLKHGMKILVREGSAAKNFEALIDLLNDYPDEMMFCSDDKHPDSLVAGHINQLCARAVTKGIDVFNVLRAACINPVLHYKLDVGLLRENDAADFIVVENLQNFKTLQTYIDGKLVAENGKTFIESVSVNAINQFNCDEIKVDDLKVKASFKKSVDVIEALDGQLITNKINHQLPIINGEIVADVDNDILKIVVVNRYKKAPVAKAFIKNLGLKHGAIASSVAHDSHNIIAVGADDESIAKAVNLIIRNKGGISCASSQPFSGKEGQEVIVALPVAGLMSAEDGYKVAEAYTKIDVIAKQLGSNFSAPFMTLSFMALLVIPHLKLSDKGLFDGDTFQFID
jgi:adenine deaminase